MSRIFPILAVAACALAREAAADEAVGWNANAEWFMYAPSFAFKEVPGAADLV